MSQLTALFTAAVRVVEQQAQSVLPAGTLMQRAGLSAFEFMQQHWPSAKRVLVVCGTGNNGGDGTLLAQHAAAHGWSVTWVMIGDRSAMPDDAKRVFAQALAAGLSPLDHIPADLEIDLCVDALLGLGCRLPLPPAISAVTQQINQLAVPVLALDLPTGVNADTAAADVHAVRATRTLTFIARKAGLTTGPGRHCAGWVSLAELSLSASVTEPSVKLLDLAQTLMALAPRPADSHKGQFGHVLVVGGELGFAGAAIMSAQAAARVGAGKVSVFTRPQHINLAVIRQPELMVRGSDDPAPAHSLMVAADVIAIGPGLGRSGWAEALVTMAIASGKPLVIDADALHLLPPLPPTAGRSWVMTPHPGEAAAMLQRTTAAVQSDRFGTAAALRQQTSAVVVLKGLGTVICGDSLSVCQDGNPGMASGGMGDILTGVIAGLMAQGLTAEQAAQAGVCLHAVAADHCAERDGQRGLLATDLLPEIRRLLG